MSTAATSPTVASFKLLRSFNEDCSLEWLETEADATPATKRAKTAIFMISECLGEQKGNTEWKLTTDSVSTQRKKQWCVLSCFWISLELQTENLLITNERAHDSSSARLACLVAKDLLEVVLQETLVRPFSGK